MAGAGPKEFLYGNRGLPAAYHGPESLGPHEPCPSRHWVTIDDIIRESSVEAREERRYSERRTGTDMEDIVNFVSKMSETMSSPKTRKNWTRSLVAAAGQRLCATGKTVRQKRPGGSGTAIEMTPSPFCRMFSAASDSEGYPTCYLSDSTGREPDFPAGRLHTAQNPELAHDAERESLPHRAASTRVSRHTGDGEEPGGKDGDRTGNTVMGGEEERGAPGKLPRDREGDDRHPDPDSKKAACGKATSGNHCHCHHVDFLIGSYAPVGQDALLPGIDKLDDTTSGTLEDQAIFDKALKTIRLHPEDNEAKLESMLVRDVDSMINFLETVEDRMRGLEKRGGIPTLIPGPCPDVPRDPALESLLRRSTTLRTAAEGVASMQGPMESSPYGPPRVDPSLLGHIAIISASVMLGEKTPEKGSGIGTFKRDAR